jgi:cytoskeletal protein RodZ
VVVALAVVVVLLIAGFTAWALRRRGTDEVHSVEGYRQTLSTLQGLGARSQGSTVRVLNPQGSEEEGEEGERIPVASTESPSWGHMPSHPRANPLVFEEGTGPAPISENAISGRGRDKAMSSMNHRPRRLGGPIAAAVIVVAAVAVLAVLGARAQHHKAKSPAASTTTSGATHRSTTTSTPKPKKTTPTTTAPPPTQLTPTNASATSATYSPAAASYTVTVTTTTGAGWVEVHSTAAGNTPLAQTIPAGGSQTVNLTGASTIELGAPSVTNVTIDSLPVVLPSGYQTPFTLTVTPTAAAPATTTTAPST